MIKFNNNSTLNDEIKKKTKKYIKKDKKPNPCL